MAPFNTRMALLSFAAALACRCLTVAAATSPAAGQWEDTVNEEGKKVQQMKIEAPAMTEEDQYGYVMPDRYRCDACRAVVYHLDEALSQRQPKSRRLQEWEYQDIFDETCRHNFKGYGITLIDGENALSGPALKKDSKLAPGTGAIQMGGETWEKRLGEICRKLVYDRVGEDTLYEHFRSDGGLKPERVCFQETRDCRVGPKAPTAAVADKAAREKKTKKEKKAKKEETLDANAFFAKMALQHGVPKAAYTGKRSFAEWETVLLTAAARVSEHAEKQVQKV